MAAVVVVVVALLYIPMGLRPVLSEVVSKAEAGRKSGE